MNSTPTAVTGLVGVAALVDAPRRGWHFAELAGEGLCFALGCIDRALLAHVAAEARLHDVRDLVGEDPGLLLRPELHEGAARQADLPT